jgi:DNA-binding CsgD family transcriptional regulator
VEIAGGNPGALVALTLALTAEQRAGRLVSPWAPLESIAVSPPPVSAGTRAVLAILAVLGAADLTEIMPVAARIGGSMSNLAEAERAALVTVTGTTVAFSHPLARIAAYAAAPLAVRAAAHLAVAEGSDSRKDTLGWHRATAALAPEEATAAVLAAAAGDLGAEEAADALQRAAELTPDPDRRAVRLGLAAAAAREAGQRTRAVALVYESHLPAMAWPAARAVVAGLEEVRLRVLAGQCVPARAQAERLARDCRRGELYGRLPEVLEVIAACHIGAGRYRDADTCAREGLNWAARSGDGVGAARLSAVRAWVAAVTGGDGPPDTGEDESPSGVEVAALREWARSAGYAASGEWERVLERPLPDGVLAVLAAPDHVEAAVRLGDRAGAIALSLRLEKAVALIGAPWADTLVTRSRMLIAGGSAEPPPREGHPFDRARAALSYGELLRKARRRGEARPWLTEALECFERLGAAPWAARTVAELAACGSPASTAARGTGSGGDVVARAGLTPQELRIVRLAARGAVNREIAVTLALSPRTVGFHLYRAFRKLGVSTRAELAGFVLPDHL